MPGDESSPSGAAERPKPSLRKWFSSLRTPFSSHDQTTLRQDLQTILEEEPATGGAFAPEELRMLRNIMALQETRVEDVMVPRADIIAVDEKVSIGELLVTFETAGHSRVPVYRDTLDDPLGMVHIKDLISHLGAMARRSSLENGDPREIDLSRIIDLGCIDMNCPIKDIRLMRSVLFVPPSMPIIDLLVKMQTTRIHMAIVVDEYGGTDGLVSIEDLVETVVGDIEDEHDVPEDQLVMRQGENIYLVDARAPIEELASALDISLDDEEAAEEVDTVGGYVFYLTGRVPVRGEIIPFNGDYEFEVLEADPRRIKRLRVQKRPLKPRRREGVRPLREEAEPRPAPMAEDETPQRTARAAAGK